MVASMANNNKRMCKNLAFIKEEINGNKTIE